MLNSYQLKYPCKILLSFSIQIINLFIEVWIFKVMNSFFLEEIRFGKRFGKHMYPYVSISLWYCLCCDICPSYYCFRHV